MTSTPLIHLSGQFSRGIFTGLSYYVILIIALTGAHNKVFSQNNLEAQTTQISRHILQLIEDNLNQQMPQPDVYELSKLDALFNIRSPQLELADKNMLYLRRIHQARQDVGLDLKAQSYFNSDPFFDDNEEGYSFARFRVRAGFDWDLFKNGLWGNQLKAKQLEKEQNLTNIRQQIEQNDRRLYFEYNLFIYYFNKAKINLLKARQIQLDRQLELLYKVYFLKGILYEEIINTRSRLEQTNVQLANYSQYNESMEKALNIHQLIDSVDIYKLPVLELDVDSLMLDTEKQKLIDSLHQLTHSLERLNANPINDISLRLQAYENISFTDNNELDRTYTSLGASLAVPLELFYGRYTDKEVARIKADNQKQFDQYEHLNKQTEIANYHYEYRYKLKQYVEFLYKEMLYREKIRVEAISQKDYLDIFRSLQVLTQLDNHRRIQLELIDLKQQMYLLLLKMYGKSHRLSILPFVNQIDLEGYYQRLSAHRSLVLERTALQSHDPYFVKNYLRTNDFENVIVETAEGLDKAKVDALRLALKGTDIGIFVMTSKQEVLSNPLTRYQLLERYLHSGMYDGIVLDMAATKTPADMDQLKAFFQNLKSLAATSAQIGIQLPLDFPYMSVAKSLDKVVLKLRRGQSVKLLDAVVRNELIEPGRLFLSVEAARFSDRIEMETFIDHIVKTYGIEHVIIEGLDHFIALDTHAFLKQE